MSQEPPQEKGRPKKRDFNNLSFEEEEEKYSGGGGDDDDEGDDSNTDTPSSSDQLVLIPFSLLTEDLQLRIGEFLPVRDLLHYQCTNKYLSKLDTRAIWKVHCTKRWESWPRYKLTKERLKEIESSSSSSLRTKSWQQRYMAVEEDATRIHLKPNDLHTLKWYLSFVLSGIRGEGRSDHLPVQFHPQGILEVPGYPPLPYEIIDGQQPPTRPDHIRQNLRGDRPFSTSQYLQISNFPIHFITRKASDAEWLVVNENVMIVSCEK